VVDDLISIVTPVYNAERFVSKTINSVLSQTYQNWEQILVNDCSTDESEEIIKGFCEQDARIKYVKLDKNVGEGGARNAGLEVARGRYIAFVDSDDLWKPNKLESQLAFMRKENIGFTFTAYELIAEDDTKLRKVLKAPKTMTYKQLLKNTVIGCSTVMIDRKIVGDFRMPVSRLFVDHPTWFSILKRGHVAYGVNEVLTEYRIVKSGLSYNKLKEMKRKWKMYRVTENMNFLNTLFYFCCNMFNAIKKRI